MALALLLIAACSSEVSRGEPRQASTLGLREIARYRGDTTLSGVRSLAIDSHGTIYVVDRGRSEILVFDSTLAPRGRIGRRGSGPGEFRDIVSVHVIHADTVLVYEITLVRLSLFEPNTLRLARSVTLEVGASGIPTFVLPSADAHWMVAGYEQPFTAGRPSASDTVRVVLLRQLRLDGTVLKDTVTTVRGADAVVVHSGQGVMASRNPFGRKTFFALADSVLYFAGSDEPALHMMAAGGGGEKSLVLPDARVPLAASVVADSIASFPDAMRDAIRQVAPARWPALRDVVVSDSGAVWIGLQSVPDRPAEWLILRSTGDTIGSLRLPWNIAVRAVKRGRVYAVDVSPDGVPDLVAYAMEQGP